MWRKLALVRRQVAKKACSDYRVAVDKEFVKARAFHERLVLVSDVIGGWVKEEDSVEYVGVDFLGTVAFVLDEELVELVDVNREVVHVDFLIRSADCEEGPKFCCLVKICS